MTDWPTRIRQIDDQINVINPRYECIDCGYQCVKRSDTRCGGCGGKIYWDPARIVARQKSPIAGEGGKSEDI
jgi:hypothetical protein